MNILAVDIGTYSLKIFETTLERRRLKLVDFQEIILSQYREDFPLNASYEEIQTALLEAYFEEAQFEGKVIYQLPNRLITTRYLQIPVANKKKAEQMIGFLIEESIPFPLSKIHFTKQLYKKKTDCEATVNLTPRDEFDLFFHKLEHSECLPNYLTSEISVIESYAKEHKFQGPLAIMDLGHETTKVYFLVNDRVISNHSSHVAGRLINEVISHTYQIPEDEAIIYKHDNCFFLTQDQYSKVNESQKEFGLLMKQSFNPLIQDFKRWELGARLNHGINIDKILILGGTSSIRNIENFLTESIGIVVKKSDFFNNGIVGEEELNPLQKSVFSLSNQMTSCLKNKNYPSNFLSGPYSVSGSENIPLQSSVFVFSRTLAFSLLIAILVLTDSFLLKRENDFIDKKVLNLIKSPTLSISSAERRNYRKKPESILRTLKKKNSEINNEISILNAAQKIDIPLGLVQFSKRLGKNKEVDVVFFESIKDETKVIFEGDQPLNVKTVYLRIKDYNFPSAVINYKDGSKRIELTYRNN